MKQDNECARGLRKYERNAAVGLVGTCLVTILALAVVVPAAAQTSVSQSLDEVNKELSNPIIPASGRSNFRKTLIG